MQKVIESNEFESFKNNLNGVMNKIHEVKDEMNVDVKMKYNLEIYNEIIKGSDEDVLQQYKTWYEKLSEIVINKNNTIKECQNAIKCFNEFIVLINKEMDNTNKIKHSLNQLIDKMIDKETIIFNNKEKEIGKGYEKRTQEFNEKLQKLRSLTYEYDTVSYLILKDISFNVKEIQNNNDIQNIIPSINKLKEWSGKQKYSIVFDSDLDGNGTEY